MTTTSFAPVVPDAGVVNSTDVSETTFTFVAAFPPIVIPVVPVNPLPLNTEAWPPASGPVATLSEDAAGGMGGESSVQVAV